MGKQREGGEDRAARILWPLSVTPHLPLHAACQEPFLAERNQGFTPPPHCTCPCAPHLPPSCLPYLFCQVDP